MRINKLILCQMLMDTAKNHGWEAAHDEVCKAHGRNYKYDSFCFSHKTIVLMDIRGYIAELVFENLLKENRVSYEYMDFVENVPQHGKPDFIIEGKTLEIKTTNRTEPNFKKLHKAESTLCFTQMFLDYNTLKWPGTWKSTDNININTESLIKSMQKICDLLNIKFICN